VLEIVMLAMICVAVREAYELTVIPAPLNERTELASKLVPLTVKLVIVWPCAPEIGEMDVIVSGETGV
jgi:hypothetical protein